MQSLNIVANCRKLCQLCKRRRQELIVIKSGVSHQHDTASFQVFGKDMNNWVLEDYVDFCKMQDRILKLA
jgi:hypothetical protein